MSRPAKKGDPSEAASAFDEVMAEVVEGPERAALDAADEAAAASGIHQPDPAPSSEERDELRQLGVEPRTRTKTVDEDPAADEAAAATREAAETIPGPEDAPPAPELSEAEQASLSTLREQIRAEEQQKLVGSTESKDGLLRELTKLREANRGLRNEQMRGMQPQAPVPGVPQPPAQPIEAPLLDMVDIRDGKPGIDPAKLQTYVNEQIAKATAPDPATEASQRYGNFRSQHLSAHPDQAESLQRAELGFQFMEETLQNYALRVGDDLRQMGPDRIVEYMQATGVGEQIRQHFPDLMDDLPELIHASAANSDVLLGRAMDRYHQRRVAAPAPQSVPTPAPGGSVTHGQPPQHTVTGTGPPSLANVGRTSPAPNQASVERLSTLEAVHNQKLDMMEPALYDEMVRLQETLGLGMKS